MKSKVSIYNSGSILNNADPADFASGKAGSKIRNPLIATVLFKSGHIDAFGTGFDRTFRVCAENDKIKPMDDRILNLLEENAYLIIPELAKPISRSDVKRYA